MGLEDILVLPKNPKKRRIAREALEVIERRGWGIYTSAEIAQVIGCKAEEVEEALGLCVLRDGAPGAGGTEEDARPFRFVRLREGRMLWPSRRCLISLLKIVPFRSY